MGFLGGVSWAILVARICQLYPNATVSTLLSKFFRTIPDWPWPLPLLLQRLPVNKPGSTAWDPRVNLRDRTHLMPVITPCYPQQNSTFNVTASTRCVIIEELRRGFDLVGKIMEGNKSWEELFLPAKFFEEYNHFVVLKTSAASPEDLAEWDGLVKSRLRLLVAGLEQRREIFLARPHEKSYSLEHNSSSWFVAMKFKIAKANLDLGTTVAEFKSTVTEQAVKFGKHKPGMNISAECVNRRNIFRFLPDNVIQRERQTVAKRKRHFEDAREILNNKRMCNK